MGSPFSIILYTDDSGHAKNVVNECFALVDSLVNIFSDYIDSSELNRLSNTSGDDKHVPISPALFDILQQSKNAHRLSQGAFDITIGPLTKLWRKARKEQRFPNAKLIEENRKVVGFKYIELDTAEKTARLMVKDMRLDLGGIAQGYIAQKVLGRLSHHAIKSALVDVSGDIALGDPPPLKNGWTIGITLPERTEDLHHQKLLLRNCAVSTSGDVYQHMNYSGKRYSHIVDPRTGYGVTFRRNVTVIAEDAAQADWLATACSILPSKEALRLAKTMNAGLMIVQIHNGFPVVSRTPDFEKFFIGE